MTVKTVGTCGSCIECSFAISLWASVTQGSNAELCLQKVHHKAESMSRSLSIVLETMLGELTHSGHPFLKYAEAKGLHINVCAIEQKIA